MRHRIVTSFTTFQIQANLSLNQFWILMEGHSDTDGDLYYRLRALHQLQRQQNPNADKYWKITFSWLPRGKLVIEPSFKFQWKFSWNYKLFLLLFICLLHYMNNNSSSIIWFLDSDAIYCENARLTTCRLYWNRVVVYFCDDPSQETIFQT